jgi:hypothetical protein
MGLRMRSGDENLLLRAALLVDAVFEFAVGTALVLARGEFARWWGIPEAVAVALGVVFLIAGAAIAAIGLRSRPAAVAVLAIANIIGAVAGWLLFIGAYPHLSPEGRWLIAAIADTALALGVVEWLLLSRLESRE